MPRIAYCTNVRLPTERAHGRQIAQVCDALASLGHDVTIFAPYRTNVVRDDYHTFYKADPKVTLTTLGSFDPISAPYLPGVLGLWTLNYLLRRALAHERLDAFDLLYTRVPALLPMLVRIGKPTIIELHTLPRRGRARFVAACNTCVRVVCLTTPMRDELKRWGITADIIVAGDAIDLDRFLPLPDRTKSRERFGCLHDDTVIGYAGSLTTMGLSKGVHHLLEAAHSLTRAGRKIRVLIAGGPVHAQRRLEQVYKHDAITFLGELSPQDVRALYSASDILVYPAPQSSHPFFQRDTSPLKIFEYMATGVPMIVADLPPLHDVLDGSTTLFVSPGDSHALMAAIDATMNDHAAAHARAKEAKKRVAHMTWDDRMRRIVADVL